MEKINDKATSNLSTKSLDFLWDDLNQYFKKSELRSRKVNLKLSSPKTIISLFLMMKFVRLLLCGGVLIT